MTLLELRDITKNFGGLCALNRISMKIEQGSFVGIIGTNGAGKTTLFNVITKYIKPDSGQISFSGTEITHLSTRAIVRRGIGRSFQLVNIYSDLSVLENIQFALISQKRENANIFSSSANLYREEAAAIADSIDISAELNMMAGTISHGDKRRLDIALALAQDPKLLLLDEPTSGLSPHERSALLELLLKLAREKSLTLVLIEHDLDVAFKADVIHVLHRGEVIADGKPEEIKRNGEVQRIYLGGG
jgi:ABC-type branched-subunit amino acid transport system ATPase component